MIILSNSIAQTLAPGQSLTFDTTVLHTGCAECHRSGSGSVGLRANNGIYNVSFRANIGSTTAATDAQLSVQMGGSPIPETTMQSYTTTVGNLNNVACETGVSTCCCNGGGGAITVTNTGTTTITVGTNSCLFIKRIA